MWVGPPLKQGANLKGDERRAHHALPRPRSQKALERTAERSARTRTGCSSRSTQRAKAAAVSAVSTCSAPAAPRSHAGSCLHSVISSALWLCWQIWLAGRLLDQLQPYDMLVSLWQLAMMYGAAQV